MDESMLLNGVLRSVLGGRGRKSRRAINYLTGGRGGSFWTNPTTLLAAAGVAWGIYETLQQKGTGGAVAATGGGLGGAASSGAPGSPVATMPPVPDTSGQGGGAISADALRIVRLAVSAANADGIVSETERAAILDQAAKAGVGALVDAELTQPRPLAEIVAGVSDPAQRATLYVLAFSMVRGDEQPSGAERIYLAQLANLLGLDSTTARQLEEQAATRIDAQTES